MGSYTVTLATHQTLVATVVDTVTIDQKSAVNVVNRDGTGLDIYFTLGLNGVTAATPTVGGADTYIARSGTAKFVDPDGFVTSVKLISSGNAAYSIEGY